MTSYDQRSDMNTGEKHGDKDSEISEDVENGGNEQENVEGEKSNEDEDVSESEGMIKVRKWVVSGPKDRTNLSTEEIKS